MLDIGKPDPAEYGEFFAGYVSKVNSDNVVQFLSDQTDTLVGILKGLTEQQASEIHAPYHWSLKQLVGHLIDGEKVFGYRLHRIACNDPTPLAGFDHEPYVNNLNYDNVPMSELAAEWNHLRHANMLFLKRIPSEATMRSGTASDAEFTVRSQAYVIAGHVQHHLEIIQKRLS